MNKPLFIRREEVFLVGGLLIRRSGILLSVRRGLGRDARPAAAAQQDLPHVGPARREPTNRMDGI